MTYGASCAAKRVNMKDGGRVSGPGTTTSDSIKADLSDEEYVLPADTTKAVGVKKLDALVAATHKPVRAGAKRRAYADGGAVQPPAPTPPPAPPAPPQLGGMAGRAQNILRGRGKQIDDASGYADGGLVTDEDQAARESTMPYGEQMAHVGGAIANGLGAAVKTIVSAPGYGFNAPAPTPAPAVGAGAGRGVVNPPAVVPAPVVTTSGGGRGSVNPPLATATDRPDLSSVPNVGGNVGIGVTGAPGVRKITTADGRTLYSNVAGADNDALMSGKPGVSVVPSIATTGSSVATESTPAITGGAYIPGVNAPLTQYEQETNARNAGVVSRFAGEGMSRAQQREATDANALRIAELSAQTSRQNNQDSNAVASQGQQLGAQTSRYGVDVAARTADQRLAVAAPEELAKAQLAISTLAARKEYADALASGDAKRVVRAEDNLRAIQGKYEKEVKPVRHLVVQGGTQPDPNNPGQYIHMPSVVFDPDTKQFISPPAQAATTVPAAGTVKTTTKAEYDALPRGAEYVGSDGKKYIKG